MDEPRPDTVPAFLPVRGASWNAERGQMALGKVRGQLAARARLERRGVALLAAAACGLAIFAVWPAQQKERAPVVVAGAGPAASQPALPKVRIVRFADGSSVELLDEHSDVQVEHAAKERVEVALLNGKGHFNVAPQPERHFVVRVSRMSIAVLGASFTVRREAERVHVRVLQGAVDVASGSEQRHLAADEAAWFVLLKEQAEDSSSVMAGTPPGSEPGETAHERFLQHARRRQYARAMEVIRQKPSVVRDNSEELMLAADAARLSGDTKASIPYLKRVSEQHARDSRAPLAAFTLGRIFLFELSEPSEARKAFALARALSAQGPLAEDALAREAEAAGRSGALEDAHKLAEQYLNRYPQGLRRAEMVRLAGPR